MSTKDPLDRSQLDSGIAHPIEWITMTNTYNKVYDLGNPDLNKDCVENYQELDVFGIDSMDASEFDCPLPVEQFMQLIGFMEAHYRAAMKRCKKSGEN